MNGNKPYGSYREIDKFSPQKKFDIALHEPNWAEYTAVEPQQNQFLKLLKTHANRSVRLAADDMDNCGPGERCGLAPCRRCFGMVKRYVNSEQLRLFADYPDEELGILSLLSPLDRYEANDLDAQCLVRSTNRIQKALARSGCSVLAIGGTDVDYDEHYGMFQIGHHLLIKRGDAETTRAALRRGDSYRSCREIRRPIQLDPIGNRSRQVCYTFKAITETRVRWELKQGGQGSRKITMKRPELEVWLRLMTQIDPLKLLVLIGARRTKKPSIELTSRH